MGPVSMHAPLHATSPTPLFYLFGMLRKQGGSASSSSSPSLSPDVLVVCIMFALAVLVLRPHHRRCLHEGVVRLDGVLSAETAAAARSAVNERLAAALIEQPLDVTIESFRRFGYVAHTTLKGLGV